MERRHRNDVGIGLSSNDDSVLVCATDRSVKAEIALVLRQDYPVRTATTEREAIESIDATITVLVLDTTDSEFSVDRFLTERTTQQLQFQTAAIVDETAPRRLRGRCDWAVRKPVDDQELRSMVRRLYRRGRYDKTLGAFYTLSERYAERASDPEANVDELRSLEEQLVQVRSELDYVGGTLDDVDVFDVALGGEDESSS